jgi:predicted Zn-dependent protease
MQRKEHDFLWVLAYFYLRHDRPAKAAALYAVLDALAPGDAVIMKSLAAAWLDDGTHDKALAVLDRLDALGETDATTHLLRGRALTLGGRPAEAADAINRFLSARSPA